MIVLSVSYRGGGGCRSVLHNGGCTAHHYVASQGGGVSNPQKTMCYVTV